MGTKKDFKVKKGLIVTDDITLDDGGSLKEAGGTAAFTFDGSGNVTKIGQDSPSNGEFLKWDGSKWVADAAGGGASTLNDLTDVISNITNFTDSILISPDGAAPPHGTLNGAINNIGIGKDTLKVLTSGVRNTVLGSYAGDAITESTGNTFIGMEAGSAITTSGYSTALGYQAHQFHTGGNNVALGYRALFNSGTGGLNIAIGHSAMYGVVTSNSNIAIGYSALQNLTSGSKNIGIGDSTQQMQTTGSRNISLGYQAIKGYPNGSVYSDNMAIGYQSMYGDGSSTSSGVSGVDNLGLGNYTLGMLTSGNRNIAIGKNALDGADAESDNIAIGIDALGGAVNGGEYNVAIGNYSLDALTSGDNNTAIGHESGSANTTGEGNTALGYRAHYQTTGSGNNVLIGKFAGYGQSGETGGHDNVAIGRSALYYWTTGAQNVLIGKDAGTKIRSGTGNVVVGYQGHSQNWQDGGYNTAVGYHAQSHMNGGAKNISLGYQAGNNITTGSNNVVIGNADVPSATGDDQLSISSGDGSPVWITGDSDGGLVLGKEGAGVVQVGDSSLNPSGINLGKLIVSRDDATSPAGPTMSLVDGDDDANTGPILKMYRNTASPADGDLLGAITFNGEDSVGGERNYARIIAVSDDVTSGSNDGSLEFRVFANGTQTDVMQLEPDAQAGAKMTLMGVSQTGAVVSGASTANNAYLNLLTVAHGTHKAITASVHITDSTNNEVQTEMIVAHYDGSAVNYTTYGQIYDGAAAIGSLEANLSGSNIIIQFKNTQGSTATIAGSIHATMHP